VSRKRLRLPLEMLGQVSRRGEHTWIWRCFVLPCPEDRQRQVPQLSEGTAEQCLVAHLRDYHAATGGEIRGTPQAG
jgi:hypothetical protein